jgi:hypothetical protein
MAAYAEVRIGVLGKALTKGIVKGVTTVAID